MAYNGPDPKPCPFCGGVKWETSFIGSTPIWFAVTCSKCGARGPAAHVEGSGTDEDINRAVDDAIARWGKRVE